MDVANEILAQLGGRRFLAMTGAKNLLGSASALSMKLPSAASRISHVRVTLTAMDDYTVDFLSIRGTTIKTVRSVAGVYCDNLRAVFETNTGLYTSL